MGDCCVGKEVKDMCEAIRGHSGGRGITQVTKLWVYMTAKRRCVCVHSFRRTVYYYMALSPLLALGHVDAYLSLIYLCLHI